MFAIVKILSCYRKYKLHSYRIFGDHFNDAASWENGMIEIHRREALGGLVALMAGLRSQAARAQARYPTRPIRMIVPFAAGGVGDTVIRMLAPTIEKTLEQRLVIESKPGASGNIGAQEVARATPDGYTLLVATANNFVINQFLMKISFDPLAALPPIAKVADIPLIFCSNPSVPVRDLSEFVQYARARPGGLNYGSPGNGSNNHLLVEKFKQLTGIELTHVPYRGAPQGAMATLTNEVQLYPMGLAVVSGHPQAGKLTALAVTSRERLPALPEVPTVVEAGFPGLVTSNWWAIAAPKGTPEPILKVLNQAIVDALASPAVANQYATLGVHVPTQTREQFTAGLQSEAQAWAEVIRRGKITLE
jgi:tripartite-type tricarboxylate transporter receptor subunit TctC